MYRLGIRIALGTFIQATANTSQSILQKAGGSQPMTTLLEHHKLELKKFMYRSVY